MENTPAKLNVSIVFTQNVDSMVVQCKVNGSKLMHSDLTAILQTRMCGLTHLSKRVSLQRPTELCWGRAGVARSVECDAV